MRSRQARERIEENDDVLPMFDTTFCLLDHHVGDLDMAIGRLIERRADDLGIHVRLKISDLLGPFVDEQHDERDFRLILANGIRDLLEQDRFSRSRWRDDQSSLPLADRRDEIHHAHAQIAVLCLELESTFWIARPEVIEGDARLGLLRLVAVDRLDFEESEIALPFFWRPHLTAYGIARAQIEPLDLRWRD